MSDDTLPRSVTVVLLGLTAPSAAARDVLETLGRLSPAQAAAIVGPARLPEVYSVREAEALAAALRAAGQDVQVEQADIEWKAVPEDAPQDLLGHTGVHERY